MKRLAVLFEMYQGLAKVKRKLMLSYIAFALSGLSLWFYLEHSNRNVTYAWISAVAISVYIVFYIIFYGYRAEVKGPGIGDRLELIVNGIVYGTVLRASILNLIHGWQYIVLALVMVVLIVGSMVIGVAMAKKKFKKQFD